MEKTKFYKEQLTKDEELFTIEITEIATKKVGVACMTKNGKDVACFYGAEDGSDDCIIPFEDFMKRFTIDRVVEDGNAYKVVVNDNDYQLRKE